MSVLIMVGRGVAITGRTSSSLNKANYFAIGTCTRMKNYRLLPHKSFTVLPSALLLAMLTSECT